MTRWHHPAALLVIGTILTATSAAQANLQIRIDKVIRAADLGSTKVAICARDLTTDERLVSINANVSTVPASNMKLITTAAALHTLEPEFIFRTELRAIRPEDWPSGENVSAEMQGGTVLLVKGDGDPAFGDPKMLEQYHDMDGEQLLKTWVEAVRRAGITHVAHLVIDDRTFDRQLVHPSWPVDQLNMWYCAQVAGLNFFNNCLDVYPEPTQMNQSPRVVIRPEAPFISTSNRAVSSTVDTFWVARHPASNDLIYMGKVKTKRQQPVSVTVHDPPIVFAHFLKDRLGRAGITVEDIARAGPHDILPAGQPLHVVQTTLPAVLQRCNKDSQNLFAEALIKRMGRKITGATGSWHNGAAAVRIFLRDMLGARGAVVQIADGSGMSRDNRVTAHVLVDILKAMFADKTRGPVFLDSLAVAGVDGTLHNRMRDLSHRVLAKSGYLRGVSTLSGYLVLPEPEPDETTHNYTTTQQSHHTIAFSFLFNDVRPPIYHYQIKALQDKLLQHINEYYSHRAVRSGG